MPSEIVPAADCNTMEEVRAGVDALDRRIVALLAERMRYIEAAARIKVSRDTVRDEARKAAVIDHARAGAAELGFPPELAGAVYGAV
jgi:isochorismate pyruvate lyase